MPGAIGADNFLELRMRHRLPSDLPTPAPDDSAEYMCDMLRGLQSIAHRNSHSILAGLLWLANMEACRLRDERRSC